MLKNKFFSLNDIGEILQLQYLNSNRLLIISTFTPGRYFYEQGRLENNESRQIDRLFIMETAKTCGTVKLIVT